MMDSQKSLKMPRLDGFTKSSAGKARKVSGRGLDSVKLPAQDAYSTYAAKTRDAAQPKQSDFLPSRQE
jgi:hypothetical protein